VRYPVSKTGGPRGLGGSTPSPSAFTEAWPSWKGSALLARRRRRRSQVRVLLPPSSLRCRSSGRTVGCYPTDAGSSPAVAAHAPIVQRSRMPVPQIGDAGSNPARGVHVHALGRVWRCGPAVSRVRRVRSPSRALLAVAQRTSTRLLPWPTGVRLLPARLRRKASSEPAGREPVEQGAIPWRRPNNDDGPAGQAPL
jgi:hypothetical protein